jgi:hypothetical protein
MMQPFLGESGVNYDLCAYSKCADGTKVTVICLAGTQVTGPNGMAGCCSGNTGSAGETVRLDPYCGTSNDGGTVYVKVSSVSGSSCGDYTLMWGDS